ncbi:MAG: choice-of-anchor D domain-containing protein, partial [Bacteroidota bacterium]
FESGDPSVNHLIIVESNGTATHEFSTNTNDDLHEVSNLSGVDRMYYLLFSAGNNGEYINDATMLNIMETFLGIVDDNSWLSAAQTLGTLAGGEQVGIDFEINASALTPGSYEQNIVFTNSGTPSAVEVPVALQVTGEVLELSLDRSAVAFGNRLLGEQVRDSVLLTNTGDSRATILETTLSHSDFAVEASSFALEPGQSRWIPFVYTAVTEGPVVATAIIRHDGEGGDLRVSLSARGRAPRARLALNRTTINFGTLDVGGVRRDSVQLTNVGDARATIHEVALDHTDFETEATSFTLAINESRWVTFTYTAVTSGPVSTRATIRHDGEGGDGLVNMSGTGRAPTAALSVDRNSINFGEVFLGEQKVDSVQIVNTGRLAARVSEVTLSHSDFAVERLSFTLAADERRWIPFTYTPTMQGPFAVTALIRHDAPGGDIGILLTGDGTEPPLVPTPTINVDPGAINVVIAPDKVVTKSLTIGNRAGTAALDWSLTIDDGVPIPSSPWLSVANTNGSVAAGGAQTIDVSMNSSGLAVGTHTANLRISSNDEDQPLLTVPVSFKVDTIIGELIMSREALYVGQALTSTSITQVVNITNSGDYAVEILNIEGANASFTITPSARVIAVGETAAFDVVFTPRWEGEATAELIWNTNIPLERDLKLVLTGVGVGAYLEPTTHFREFSSDAGEASLVIETNLEQFTASSEADWLTFDYGENDLLNADNLIVRYASNPRAEVRQAAILISGGGLTRSVFVSQEGRNAYIELSRDSVNLLPGHGSFELELSTSLEDWEVFDLPDWIRYRVAGSTLTFLYDSNPLVARTASLEIGHGVTTAKVFVRQEGTAPFLIVPNTTFAIDRMGGDIEVAVQTNTAYVASTEQDWVSIVTTDDGLKVVVDRLISAQPRLATVVLSADQVNDINITVEQLREGVVLDVKDEPEIQFSYYPNPATHQVTVKSRRLQSVRLFTTNGTKITPQMRKLIGSIVMDVRDLQQGLYFMEAELNDGTVQIEKLIIE